MPISMLLLQDSRAILYLLEFAESDVISSQPHSKLRLQTHIVPSRHSFQMGCCLAKRQEPCYNFTHRWKLKNPHSLSSRKAVFSLIDKDLMQPATDTRKKQRCLHLAARDYSPFLRTVLTTHSLSLESPSLLVSPVGEFCLLLIPLLSNDRNFQIFPPFCFPLWEKHNALYS